MKHHLKVKEDKQPHKNLFQTFHLHLRRLQIIFHKPNKKAKQQKQILGWLMNDQKQTNRIQKITFLINIIIKNLNFVKVRQYSFINNFFR